MPRTEYYHTRDPIENLRVSVTLRKISSFEGDTAGEIVPVGRTWSYCFRWQEKKFSSAEKRRDERRLERISEFDLRPRRRQRKENGKAATESKDADVLSSYIDAEDFIPRQYTKDPVSSSTCAELYLVPPELSRRPRGQELGSPWTANHQRVWLRSNREDKFCAMHVVALVEGHEHVLCSLRFYKARGLLCATPGFSKTIVDPESDPELWVKGPQLSTYRFTAQSGCQYEYAVDNSSDLAPFVSREDQRLARELQLQDEKLAMVKAARWDRTILPSDRIVDKNIIKFKSMENAGRRLSLSLEFVAVENPQTTDPVGVEYELILPTPAGVDLHWVFEPPEIHRRHGKTPLSLPHSTARSTYSTTAAFGWHQNFHLRLKTETLAPSKNSPLKPSARPQPDHNDLATSPVASPVLYVSMHSRDSWGRKHTQGYGELKFPSSSGFFDFDVPIRKPIMSICDQMEELFLGVEEFSMENEESDKYTHHQSVHSDGSASISAIVNRLGQKSESTPTTVRIRLNIVEQFPPEPKTDASTSRVMPDAAHVAQTNARIVKRSVHEILQSVKLQKRLATATDPSARAALRSLPGGDIAAVDSLLASVGSSEKQ